MSYFAADNSLLFDYARKLLARRSTSTDPNPTASSLSFRGTSPSNLSLWDSSGARTYTTYSRSLGPSRQWTPSLTRQSSDGTVTPLRSSAPPTSAQSAWTNLSRLQQAGRYSTLNSTLSADSIGPRPSSNPAVKPNRPPSKLLWSATSTNPLSPNSASYWTT